MSHCKNNTMIAAAFVLGVSGFFSSLVAADSCFYQDLDGVNTSQCAQPKHEITCQPYSHWIAFFSSDDCPTTTENFLGYCSDPDYPFPEPGRGFYYYFVAGLSTTFEQQAEASKMNCEHQGYIWMGASGTPDAPQIAGSAAAQATCGISGNPSISTGSDVASCVIGDALKASADLPNAAVRVFSSSSGYPQNTVATASVVDLITVTSGFDGNGNASGTFDLDIEGMIGTDSIDNKSQVEFFATIWYPWQPTPPCIDDIIICGFSNGPYDYAQVYFSLVAGNLSDKVFNGGGGSGVVQSTAASDLRATLTVPWTVTQDYPSFFVAVYGLASTPANASGDADFLNTAEGGFTGPAGFQYSGKNGFASNLPSAQPADSPVDLRGRVQLGDGTDLCALVLASGQYMFTCSPYGPYELTGLPREPDGTVRRQVYVDGTFPNVETVKGTVNETVIQRIAGNCPSYNLSYNPGVFPNSAGKRHSISGQVVDRDTETPICAMVLANGSYMFSCDGSGSYNLDFPLDANGQYQLQVYADGFAPTIQTFDEMISGGYVRMARASECQ